MNKNTRIIISAILAVATVGWLCFIFGNSLKDAVESSEQSSEVCRILQQIVDTLGLGIEVKATVVRTLAHFAEFAILGMLLCADILFFIIVPKKLSPLFLAVSPALSLVVAFIDECLQKLSNGRHFDPVDIATDFSGALVGAVVTTAIFLLARAIRSKNEKKSISD